MLPFGIGQMPNGKMILTMLREDTSTGHNMGMYQSIYDPSTLTWDSTVHGASGISGTPMIFPIPTTLPAPGGGFQPSNFFYCGVYGTGSGNLGQIDVDTGDAWLEVVGVVGASQANCNLGSGSQTSGIFGYIVESGDSDATATATFNLFTPSGVFKGAATTKGAVVVR
jgi:hypothetical protein